MFNRSVPRVFATLALIGVMACAMQLTAAATAEAQDNYKSLTRLGGANRFDQPLKDAAAVQKWVARKVIQTRLTTVMDKAGLAALTPTVIDILTKADPTQFTSTTFEPGGTMVWMAFRRGGRPDIVRNLRWDGKKGFEGFTFVIDDMVQTYTFVLPKICANLVLVTAEPSREKARLDAERAEKERLERERLEKERAAAEKARLDAERREKERLEKERLEKERLAAEQAEKDRLAAEQAEKDRLAAEQLAREQKEKIDWFVGGYFGKERRVREEDIDGHTVEGALCSPLLGVTFGPEFKVSPQFKLAPTFGVAVNFEDTSYTSVFAEVQANYYTSTDMKTYFGAGFGVWDFTHTDWVAPTLSLQFGTQVWTNAKDDKLFFVGEGRMFLGDELENNYQFWAGMRYVIR